MEEVALHVVVDSLDYLVTFLEYLLFVVASNKDVCVVGVKDELPVYGAVDDVVDVNEEKEWTKN